MHNVLDNLIFSLYVFWQMSSLKLLSDMENKHQMTDISIQVTIRWLLTANYEETFLGSPSLLSVTH